MPELDVLDLLRILVGVNVQVVFLGVVCHKHREKARIFFRIWVTYITFLEVYLKDPPS